MCSSSGELIVLIQYLTYVTLCRWRSSIQTCTLDGHLHRVTYARYRINTVDSPWWWANECSKHVEIWNIYIRIKNCASSWLFTRGILKTFTAIQCSEFGGMWSLEARTVHRGWHWCAVFNIQPKFSIHIHLESRLGMCGAIPLLPQYAFMFRREREFYFHCATNHQNIYRYFFILIPPEYGRKHSI